MFHNKEKNFRTCRSMLKFSLWQWKVMYVQLTRMRGKNLSIGHRNSYSQSHSHRQRWIKSILSISIIAWAKGGTRQNIELQKRPTYKFTGSICLNFINLKMYIKFYLEIIIWNDVAFGTNLSRFWNEKEFIPNLPITIVVIHCFQKPLTYPDLWFKELYWPIKK